MKAIAAVLDRREENVVPKIVSMLEVLGRRGADAYCMATPDSITISASPEKFREFKAPIALGHVFLKVLVGDKPRLTRLGNLTLLFDGRIYNPQVECLDSFIAQKLQADGIHAVAEALIKELDGCFAFALAENRTLIVGRDALGLYPLYYGDNGNLFAVASERKALWGIGIDRVKPLPPGHFLTVDVGGFQTRRVKSPEGHVQPWPLEKAVEELQGLLLRSTLERTANLDRVAVAFSGGLDSSLTAFLAWKAGVEVHLIHVSLESRPETFQAEEAARLLGLPFHKFLYHVEDVERVLPEVLRCVESPDPLKTSIAIPLFWAAERAAELGFKVLLTGQGADELFGGYRRYLTLYTRFNEGVAQEAITSDIMRMHEENFERDFKICGFHNVELRLPFASYPIVKFALGLPLNLKINSKEDFLRKLVLRKTAEKLGLPKQIVYRPKRAVQYATGVDKVLKRLAKGQGFSLEQYLWMVFSRLMKCSDNKRERM